MVCVTGHIYTFDTCHNAHLAFWLPQAFLVLSNIATKNDFCLYRCVRYLIDVLVLTGWDAEMPIVTYYTTNMPFVNTQ